MLFTWPVSGFKVVGDIVVIHLLMFLTTTGIFKSTCHIDVRWFPFDVQRCDLKFGSWTYGGWSLDLKMLEADITGYIANGEWDLVGKRGLVSCGLDWYLNMHIFHQNRLCFVLQRFQEERTSAFTNAVRSLTLILLSLWWCAEGPSTTVSICSSRVSWSPLWLCWSSSCLLTLGKRSHWVWKTETHTLTYCRVLYWRRFKIIWGIRLTHWTCHSLHHSLMLFSSLNLIGSHW